MGKNGLWTPQTFLTSPSNNIQQQYGTSVAIYNQTCIVSAPSASDGTGVAYFYEAHQVSPAPSAAPVPGVPSQAPTWYPSNAGAWEAEQQVLQSSPALPDSYFSVSMAFQEGGVLAVVGANGQDDSAGAVFVFTREYNLPYLNWEQFQELSGTGGAAAAFGTSVDVSNNVIVVGASNEGMW